MPTPKKDESREDFIKRCIPEVLKDGTAKDGSQGNAVCNSIWKDKKNIGDSKMADGKPINTQDDQRKKLRISPVNGKCPEGYTLKADKKGEKMCFLNETKKPADEKGKFVEEKKDEGDTKMTNEKVQSKVVSLFSNEEEVSKFKEVLEKLEKADSLEAAKLLVVEFRTLIPEAPAEEAKVEEKKEEETKEEDKKEEKAEEVKEEDKKGEESKETADAPKVKGLDTQLTDALDLNQKMITKLEESSKENSMLSDINEKLKKDVSTLTDSLKVYQDTEAKEEKDRLSSKFNEACSKYCDFMDIPKDERKAIEKQMSTYSEDMLDNTLKYVQNKQTQMSEDEVEVETKPSSELSEEATVMTQDDYNDMSARDKTSYLHGLIAKGK